MYGITWSGFPVPAEPRWSQTIHLPKESEPADADGSVMFCHGLSISIKLKTLDSSAITRSQEHCGCWLWWPTSIAMSQDASSDRSGAQACRKWRKAPTLSLSLHERGTAPPAKPRPARISTKLVSRCPGFNEILRSSQAMQPLQPCKIQMKYNEMLRCLMQSQFRVKSTACRLWKGLTWPEGLCTQTCQRRWRWNWESRRSVSFNWMEST